MFRFKSGIRVSYNRQGYIYFASLLFGEMTAADQKKIRTLCLRCGGEYGEALMEFVTTDADATYISRKYNISRETLHRCVRRYYERFPKKL